MNDSMDQYDNEVHDEVLGRVFRLCSFNTIYEIYLIYYFEIVLR